MIRKPRAFIVAVGAALLVVAIACGGGADPTATASPDSLQPTSTPSGQATPTETGAPTATSVAEPTTTAAPTSQPAGDIRRGGHFIFGVSQGFPSRWDMTQDSVFFSPQHFARHYNGLLQFSARDGATIMPSLANEWEIGNDANEFTLTLFPDLQWHDGTPVTIEDVVWALERWVDPPAGINLPRVSGFAAITDVEAIDDATLKITIADTNVHFLADLADPWHIIVPRHIAETGIDSGNKLVGTGPWQVGNFERDNFVSSTPNPNYHRMGEDGEALPYLDQITSISFSEEEAQIAALRTGRIDMMSEVNVENTFNIQNQEGSKFNYDQWINPGLQRLAMNNQVPPFNNVDARKALYLAIDRLAYADILQTPGLPPLRQVASFFGSTDPFWDEVPTLFGYDPATRDEALGIANELAQSSGLMDYNGQLKLTTNAAAVPQASVLQQLLEESLGLTVEIDSTDTNSMFARYGEGDFELGFYGTGVLHADPRDQIIADWMPGAGRNYGWEPPQNWLDLWEESNRTLPGPELNEIYREMDRIMREEWIPAVPLERATGSFVISYPYVHNFNAYGGCKFKCFQLEDVWVTEAAPTGR